LKFWISKFAKPFLEEAIKVLFRERVPLLGWWFSGAGVHPVFKQ
jgi:hypothetical protein